tara:strand:- start:8 stop:418 length:411 start_codon:yes stop_codon:yes gene_type:complete
MMGLSQYFRQMDEELLSRVTFIENKRGVKDMGEFETGDKIEVSNFHDFTDKHVGEFQCDLSTSKNYNVAVTKNHRYIILTEEGFLCAGEFAREIDPLVTILVNDKVNGVAYYGKYKVSKYKVRTSLMDKIIAGEFQ